MEIFLQILHEDSPLLSSPLLSSRGEFWEVDSELCHHLWVFTSSLEYGWQVYFSHLEIGDRLQRRGLQTELYYFEVNVWGGGFKVNGGTLLLHSRVNTSSVYYRWQWEGKRHCTSSALCLFFPPLLFARQRWIQPSWRITVSFACVWKTAEIHFTPCGYW